MPVQHLAAPVLPTYVPNSQHAVVPQAFVTLAVDVAGGHAVPFPDLGVDVLHV